MLEDAELSEEEQIVRSTIEEKVAGWTEYSPKLDNRDDRGKVKTLSHVVVKNSLYFCSHDAKALRLVDDTEILETNLENVQTIKLYEIIFYLIKKGNLSKGETKAMKALYKYQYHLTDSEKQVNPEWGGFKNQLDSLYSFLLIDAKT